jgi:rare lipoprotein A
MTSRLQIGWLCFMVLSGCVHRVQRGVPSEGFASWYGPELAGHRTANGERFNPAALTAAHRTLPFDTCVTVTLKSTARSVDVRINDRGPFHGDRIVDVSQAAAQRLGLKGVEWVRLSSCR